MSTDDYAVNFPRYCRICSGIGGHKADPDRMPTDCPDCYGRGLCGRCAVELPEYAAVCSSCGWRVFEAADALPGANFV